MARRRLLRACAATPRGTARPGPRRRLRLPAWGAGDVAGDARTRRNRGAMDGAAGRAATGRARRRRLQSCPPAVAAAAARALACVARPRRGPVAGATPAVLRLPRADRRPPVRPGPRAGVASAAALGRLGAVGDQGARLVRIRKHRPIRRPGEVARIGERYAVRRRASRVPGDGSAAAGLDGAMPGPLGRVADERALACDPVGAWTRLLRAAAADRNRDGAGDAVQLPAAVDSIHRPARRGCRIRRYLRRCGLRHGGDGALAVGSHTRSAPMLCWPCFARWPASRSRRKASYGR